MSYWRLIVHRSHELPETLDLRTRKRISAGDEPANDICIQTIELPSRHPMLRMRWGKPELNLSKEVISSLSGSFKKKSDWKNRLYEGSKFEVTGICEWDIENVHFRIEEVKAMALSSQELEVDRQARKHWWQSVGMATGFHAALFIIFFAASFIWNSLTSEPEENLQSVSIVEIQQVFPPPKAPEPQETAPAEQDKPAQVKAERSQPSTASARPSKRAAPESAAAASGSGRKQDLSSMGLLALQATPQDNGQRLSIDRARVTGKTEGTSAGVSLERSSLGIEVQTGKAPVASLAGLSSGAYQAGEIGDELGGGEVANTRLVRREVEVRGGLDPALVQQIIEERLAQVRSCYESALRTDNSLAGKIETAWTIQANGSVSNLQISSADLTTPSLHDCIRGRIGAWSFPEPKGGGIVNVKYPFVFSPLGS